MKSAKKLHMARLIFTAMIAITGLSFKSNSVAAQTQPEQQQVVVSRDITSVSGCMYGEDGTTPAPCPANTVRTTMVVSETDAKSKGEIFVRINSESEVNSATQQLLKELDRRRLATSNQQSIILKGEKVLMKPASQGCGGVINRIFFFQTFPAPQTQVKFTVPYYKSFGGGGCNDRYPTSMVAELQFGPNVYLTQYAWSTSTAPGGYWTGGACNLMNTSVSYPTSPPVYYNVSSGLISVQLRRNGCTAFDPSSTTYWNLP